MKRCPQCERTYSDESISFCVADGTLLSPSYNDPAATLSLSPRPTDGAQTLVLARSLSPEKARSIIRRNWIIGAVSVPIGAVISLGQFSNVPGHENQSAAALAAGAALGAVVYGYFGWSASWGYPAVWRWWSTFAMRILTPIKQSIHRNAIATVLMVLAVFCLFAPLLGIVCLYFYSLFLVGLAYSLFGGGIYQFVRTRKVAKTISE